MTPQRFKEYVESVIEWEKCARLLYEHVSTCEACKHSEHEIKSARKKYKEAKVQYDRMRSNPALEDYFASRPD